MKFSEIFILECRAKANSPLQTTPRVERRNSGFWEGGVVPQWVKQKHENGLYLSMLCYLFCNIENKVWYQPVTQAVTLHS